MLSSVMRFSRLAYVFLAISALGRFVLPTFFSVPFSARPNAVFSVVVLTGIMSLCFGAMSKSVGGFDWKGTALTGASIGVVAQLLIFFFTVVSMAAGQQSTSYYLIPQAAGFKPDEMITWGTIVGGRALGLVINTVIAAAEACLGRLLFAGFAPTSAKA